MSVIAELKRRNVFRVAALYLVAAWVLLQVGDLLFGLLGLPAWSNKLLFAGLVLGFVPALIFSWVYELTPEGLKREHEIERNASITAATARKLDLIVVGLLVIAIVVVAVERFIPRTAPIPAATDAASGASSAEAPVQAAAKSIAVLPFADMSSGKDQEYFADGLSEELLNLLAKLPELRVIGRTSSFQFKGRNEDLRVIGEKLNVAHILEGSVRKSGEKVRITAQLIRAADGSHLWSETYDRTLDDIFVVQDDIAGEVVKALKLTLLGTALTTRSKPQDSEAYNLALQGRFFLERRGRRGPRACSRVLPAVARARSRATPRPGRACRRHTRGRPTTVSCRSRTAIDGRARPRRRRWRSIPSSLTRIWRWAGFTAVTTGTGRPRTPAIAQHWTWSPATPRPSGTPASRR